MSFPQDRLSELSGQLTAIAEQLGDLAIDSLRAALELGDDGSVAAARTERRITRARRSVEKAAVLLSERQEPEGDEV